VRRPDRVSRSALSRAVQGPIAAVDRTLNRSARGLAPQVLPFYRRHPCEGPLGLFTVDLRGAFSPEDGFFFNRIPKAANSTVMATLAACSDYRRSFARDRKKSRFLRPSRMSTADVARLGDGTLRFTFVRAPYGRALSAFADKVLRRRRQARPFYDWLGRVGPEPPAFIDFLRFLDDGGAHGDAHWAPQADLMLLPVGGFDLVGKLETLDRDLGAVTERLFGTDAPLRIRRAGPRTDSRRNLADAYDAEGLAIVNRVYAADFALFGYPTRAG
jgi:hypothetical protein